MREFPDPPDARRCTAESDKSDDGRCRAWALKNDPRQLCMAHAGLSKKAARIARKKVAGTYDVEEDGPPEAHEIIAERTREREARWAANATPPALTEHERQEGWKYLPQVIPQEAVNLDHREIFKLGDSFAIWRKVPKDYYADTTFGEIAAERGAQRDRDADARIAQDFAYLRTIHNDVRGMSRAEIDALPPLAIEVANLDPRLLPRGFSRDDLVNVLIREEQAGIPVDLDSSESDRIVGQTIRDEFGG